MGVHIDRTLSFDEHVTNVCKKDGRKLSEKIRIKKYKKFKKFLFPLEAFGKPLMRKILLNLDHICCYLQNF